MSWLFSQALVEEYLGDNLLGWRTVCAVEWEPYPASVLCARQNDGFLPPFPIWDDVQTFDGKPWRGIVDVVSGGFPCQDISIAGQGAGLEGEQSGMWKQMARIIGEVRPRHAFIENSPMLTIRGLDRVLCDLAALGYDAQWGVISAADCGAPHKRERIWIVAYATQLQRNGSNDHAGISMESGQKFPNLETVVGRRTWPTPTAHNAKETNAPSEAMRNEPTLASRVGGHLNPTWVEWLMGWPLGWTDLKPLETDKFQSWLRAHLGGCDE
jgi:site-specific DNA-cytosine methylase